jgi:RNA-directed DNA polymerase
VTCRTRAEAENALAQATKILDKLGVTLNREKTRIVHITKGFEFLGFKIQQGRNRFKLSRDRIKSRLNRQNLYAIPTQKSLDRFKDQIRALTKRQVPLRLGELIQSINPVIRGWVFRDSSDGRSATLSDGRLDWPTVGLAQPLV